MSYLSDIGLLYYFNLLKTRDSPCISFVSPIQPINERTVFFRKVRIKDTALKPETVEKVNIFQNLLLNMASHTQNNTVFSVKFQAKTSFSTASSNYWPAGLLPDILPLGRKNRIKSILHAGLTRSAAKSAPLV